MRKLKSLFNMIGSLGSYFVAMIFTFITQACIVKILGVEYNGVNGLFNNIITMLSVAELGIGTTIIFKLYKPIAENNTEKIKSWLNFYKICYRFVAIIIAIAGLFLIPFVPVIVGETSIPENIIILYLISLLDTILSYVMTYKRSLLYADQKNYIINIVHIVYIIFMNITQIILLKVFKSYVIFLAIKLIYRILENVIINIYVDKNYKYVNEKSKKIDKSEQKDVFQRIKSMLLQKVSFVINKGIDNVIISYFLGIATVGYYTNYNIIVTAVNQIIYQIVSSLTASVGNLLTENDVQKSYDIYRKINMLNSFFSGIVLIGFVCVIQPFICLWVGEKYILSNLVVLSFAIYIYSDSIRRAITIYKEAAGICKEDRWMYAIMAGINLISSIILCKILGMAGVILGTTLGFLFLIVYSYPKYIFSPLFKKSWIEYYKENIKYIIFMFVASIVSLGICKNISISDYFLQIAIYGIVAVIIGILTFTIMFYKTKEFKYYIDMMKKIIRKIRKNGGEK